MENKKIDFQTGAENLSNDAEYQQALAKFNAENFSPEQIAKYKKRKQIAIAMIVLGVFIFFVNLSISMMLIFLSLIFFVKPKFDELAFRKEKFAKENGLAILPDDYSTFPNSAFDRMNSRYTNFHRFNRFRKNNTEFGFYHYETGGKSSVHFYTFYVEETLPFVAQNLVIDSKTVSRIKTSKLHKDNLVKLEGNFHDYFEIETEEGREMEALAFLAPDVMAALIDNFMVCDIEFFDNKVRFYFVADYSNAQDPVGVFDYMAEKFSVADRFLEQYRAKFVHLKVAGRFAAVRKVTAFSIEEIFTPSALKKIAIIAGVLFAVFGIFGFLAAMFIKDISLVVFAVLFCIVAFIITIVQCFFSLLFKR